MKRFNKILVGVDLKDRDALVSDNLAPTTEDAVERALWLAKRNSARLLFLYALDVSSQAQRLILERQGSERTLVDHAKEVLGTLVERAGQAGVAADCLVVLGNSWREIIRRVLLHQHDLVIVGARHLRPVRSFFVGSTGIKLLRKCPCPVWITQRQPDRRVASILVAHDLRPVGDLAMDLGCSMARLHNAQLHVIHAAEFPEFDYMLPAMISAESMFPAAISAEGKQEYRREAEEQITAQLASADLSLPAQLHFVTEPPDVAIMDCVERYNIDLIVMGTVGRTGIAGFITGHTAERLLPQIPCSVLAVKPPGFASPITLENESG